MDAPQLSRIWFLIAGFLAASWIAWKTRSELPGNVPPVSILQPGHFAIMPCLEKYSFSPNCSPATCGRGAVDDFVKPNETVALLKLAEQGIRIGGGGQGGVSIVDFVSGASSSTDKFVDLYAVVARRREASANVSAMISNLAVYTDIVRRVKQHLVGHFGIDNASLYVSSPSFFSRITDGVPANKNDEYWHVHNDRLQYGAFVYTCLVYLNSHGDQFSGGRFVFVDANDKSTAVVYVEPRAGRLLCFTSGEENLHHVERVTRGVRYALTIAFTCDARVGSNSLDFLHHRIEQLEALRQQD